METEVIDLSSLAGTNVGVIQTKMRPTQKLFRLLLKALKIENLDSAYNFFKRIENSEYRICFSCMCADWARIFGKYAQTVYNYKKRTLNLEKFAKNVIVMENPNFSSIFRTIYKSIKDKYSTYMTWNEIQEKNMKFNLVVTNPPYSGNARGGKLYMQMMKVFYGQLLEDGNSKIVAIHPTSVIDGEQDPQFKDLRMDDFIKIDSPKEVFPDAKIKTGLGIFVYSKNGEYKLYSDEIKEKNMSEYELKKWIIYKKIRNSKDRWISYAGVPGQKEIRRGNEKRKKEMQNIWKTHHCMVLPGICGAAGDLICQKWLTPKYEYIELSSIQIFPFKTKKKCVDAIKWISSDVCTFIGQYIKGDIHNNILVLSQIPLPPDNWNYDDASVMQYLGLTQEEMDFIHEDVKNKGLKAQMGKTESELMYYIDEINK